MNKKRNTSFDFYPRNNLLKSKLAQGLSITTIILIVLGVLVLIGLVLGFTRGWNSLMPWIKPTNNVDDIVSQCSVACGLSQQYNFCTMKRTLKAEGGVEIKDTNCNALATDYPDYGVEECSAVTCPVVEEDADCATHTAEECPETCVVKEDACAELSDEE